MLKKSAVLTIAFALLFLVSSCNASKTSIDYDHELQLKQDELQKLTQENEILNKEIELLQNQNKILQSQLDEMYSSWSTDLTGDGINEIITGPPSPTPISLFENGGSLMVKSAEGDILLDEKTGILNMIGIYDAGAKTPVLITLQWGGGSMGNYYGAYLFDPVSNKLKRIQWDNYEVAVGLLYDNKCKSGSIVIMNRGLKPDGFNQPFYQRWIYKNGQMTPVEKWDADDQ
ncbi:hypothetical protein OXPF_03280 [Oxobacter pfennigii]|uniref:Uncharacterized protein n=1 Tax=Oxobacter pfennigii TaxID=36849 RepID=A0A0P8WDN5_9CLOT|nr:bZIP transcription factor [Oxobacter pfennigii]KPU45860.1 hypothetical protein OXPF_03280 [Oxobacter pfennigii]